MKKWFLILGLFAVSPAPVHAARYDFGQGAAAVACAMLDSGYSKRQVYRVLNLLERQIIRGGTASERSQAQMVTGFNYQARNNDCPLRYRY